MAIKTIQTQNIRRYLERWWKLPYGMFQCDTDAYRTVLFFTFYITTAEQRHTLKNGGRWFFSFAALLHEAYNARVRYTYCGLYIFNFHSPKYSHFISMVTEVFTGIVILLFEALHVSSARRSSLLIFGIDNVFWTVCL